MEFAENLKRLREEKGWSQEKLASIAGLTRSTIGAIENNYYTATERVLKKLYKAFGISVGELGIPPNLKNKFMKKARDKERMTIPEGKVKACFNQACLLNKNCFCQSPIVVNQIAGCKGQHDVKDTPEDKNYWIKYYKNRQGRKKAGDNVE